MTEIDQVQKIRERAFAIWEEEGRPVGRDREHWLQAKKELGFSAQHDAAPAKTGAAAPKE